MTTADTDTIVAIATAPGAGGVGVVRLSGPRSRAIAEALCGCALVPRHAHYVKLRAGDETLDDGIALYFAAPASFTGEHVVELQAHGSPVVLRRIVAECNALRAMANEIRAQDGKKIPTDIAAELLANIAAASATCH